MIASALDLGLEHLRQAYVSGKLTPLAVVEAVYRALAAYADPATFIHLVPEADAQASARELMALPAAQRGPLYGIPFAVKDNIDVAGLPTTAACPSFRYVPAESATAVRRLLDAGAIVIGKTNLDQFATGLVGVRSPYGVPRSPFEPKFIPGGSSSGSGVAVAAGLVTFALGTDTAGSGRIPAGMNNIVGIKPTRGGVSTHGVVPACRAQDCVSVFSGDVSEGVQVLAVMAGADAKDPYRRPGAATWDPRPIASGQFRFGVPRPEQLLFFDPATRDALLLAAERLVELGGRRVEIDFEPFSRTGALLYGQAWVAQRLEATQDLFTSDPKALDPTVRQILEGAVVYRALDAYLADARLSALRNESLPAWREMDVLLVPTMPGPPTVEQVRADPIGLNSKLGTYTNFVNLLDLCAVAVPASFGEDGVPRGVTLIAPAEQDGFLFGVADALHRASGLKRGATSFPIGPAAATAAPPVRIVVAGAHMQGMALNQQLTSLGARLLERTRTAPSYRFYALQTEPPKPALVRVEPGQPGHAIEVEVWALSAAALGVFAGALPAPMCLGSVELGSGERVLGFLCEPYALGGAREISELGGWRRYVAQGAGSS
jgi:allophanate hydrolase